MNERQPTLEPDFKAFKDGVYDAIIHGRKAPVTELSATFIRGQPSGHYYNRGYDFGLSINRLNPCVHSDEEEEE